MTTANIYIAKFSLDCSKLSMSNPDARQTIYCSSLALGRAAASRTDNHYNSSVWGVWC